MSGGVGHNSKPDRISADVSAEHLRAYIERVERLESEIKDLNDDKAEVYAEARGTGYDAKIMKKIVSRRRMDRQKRIEEDEIMSLYLEALGEE